MFRWLTRSRHVSTIRRPSRARLYLEALETRECPTAPNLMFSIQSISGATVTLSGVVFDQDPTTCNVNFWVVASASVTPPNSSGQFTLQAVTSAPGTIYGQAVDNQPLYSSVVQASLNGNPPSLTLNLASGVGNTATLSGQVTDASPSGLTVTFSGAITGSTTTDSNGNYSFTTTNWTSGTVTAQTTDPWGRNSNAPTVVLSNVTPVISNFTAVAGSGGLYTFQGQITAGYSSNMTVKLWGISTLNGSQGYTTVTVGSDGWFRYTVQLTSQDHGTVCAEAINWDGLTSDIVMTSV